MARKKQTTYPGRHQIPGKLSATKPEKGGVASLRGKNAWGAAKSKKNKGLGVGVQGSPGSVRGWRRCRGDPIRKVKGKLDPGGGNRPG